MRLNPLNRKSNGYFARITTEYRALERELADAQAQLETAEAELERQQRRHQQLAEQGTRYTASLGHDANAASTRARPRAPLAGHAGVR
jgi:chromosome segregation ATPase